MTAEWIAANEAHLAAGFARLRRRLGDDRASGAAEFTAPDAALVVLAKRFGLSKFEEDLLLLCAGVELTSELGDLCAQRQPDKRPQPSFALALAVLENPTWEALSPERPLRSFRLLEVHQPPGTPFVHSTLRVDERIVNYLKGLDHLDERLGAVLSPVECGAPAKAPSCRTVVESIVEEAARGRHAPPLFQFTGTDPASKRLIAREVAQAFGARLYIASAEALPQSASDQETFVRLWSREVRLTPLVLLVDAYESAPARLLERLEGLVFADVAHSLALKSRPTVVVETAKPTPSEQRNLWIDALGEENTDPAQSLAGQFRLDEESIRRIAENADDADRRDRLWEACRRHSRPRLDSLARRIDAKATWDDLVLPTEERAALEAVANQVRCRGVVHDDWGFGDRCNRGLGVSVLFSGESGTGKTMAAEVLAAALDLDLYRIDLSAVVDKYIGETEKNLRRVFDAADDGGCILFFDEADALFGKRSDVKDSHDRYANIEVNYLLQRMESYRGLAILATNLKSSLDTAFLRRLRFVINFPIPSPMQRRDIWTRAFPDGTPQSALDFDRLGRLQLTGGNIHTIALNAAFAAAGNGGVVDMEHVLSAARLELQKLNKPTGFDLMAEAKGARRS